MDSLKKYLQSNPLSILLIAFPLAILASLLRWGQIWVFILSAVGVVPMAGYIGEATEHLAVHTGPKIGGILNASLGNAAELIITLAAINAGLLELVKASITGSIIGNLLLIMGTGMFAGGLKNGIQKFDQRHTGNYTVLLMLAVAALVIPSIFSHSIGTDGSVGVESLSLGVAVVMIVLYGAGLFYTLKVSQSPLTVSPEEGGPKKSAWSIRHSVLVLAAATVSVVILSELLVGGVETVVASWGVSEFFLGIILIPIVGNVAEHLVAVSTAVRNQMDLSIEISVSSSLQIALFVAPLLVFLSLAMGHPLTLIFNVFELVALAFSVVIASLVAFDGESNWLEGAALLAVYVILAISFFLLPTGLM